eukprot:762107-Hanusia_phi.AAC.1
MDVWNRLCDQDSEGQWRMATEEQQNSGMPLHEIYMSDRKKFRIDITKVNSKDAAKLWSDTRCLDGVLKGYFDFSALPVPVDASLRRAGLQSAFEDSLVSKTNIEISVSAKGLQKKLALSVDPRCCLIRTGRTGQGAVWKEELRTERLQNTTSPKFQVPLRFCFCDVGEDEDLLFVVYDDPDPFGREREIGQDNTLGVRGRRPAGMSGCACEAERDDGSLCSTTDRSDQIWSYLLLFLLFCIYTSCLHSFPFYDFAHINFYVLLSTVFSFFSISSAPCSGISPPSRKLENSDGALSSGYADLYPHGQLILSVSCKPVHRRFSSSMAKEGGKVELVTPAQYKPRMTRELEGWRREVEVLLGKVKGGEGGKRAPLQDIQQNQREASPAGLDLNQFLLLLEKTRVLDPLNSKRSDGCTVGQNLLLSLPRCLAMEIFNRKVGTSKTAGAKEVKALLEEVQAALVHNLQQRVGPLPTSKRGGDVGNQGRRWVMEVEEGDKSATRQLSPPPLEEPKLASKVAGVSKASIVLKKLLTDVRGKQTAGRGGEGRKREESKEEEEEEEEGVLQPEAVVSRESLFDEGDGEDARSLAERKECIKEIFASVAAVSIRALPLLSSCSPSALSALLLNLPPSGSPSHFISRFLSLAYLSPQPLPL